MQNPISLDLPPEGLILDPFQAPGVHLPGPTPGLWRILPAPRVHVLGQDEPPRRAIEIATLPLHVTDLWLRPTGVTLGGRHLLSGRAGLGVLQAMNPGASRAFFAQAQARPGPRRIAPLTEDIAPGAPFALPPALDLAETLAHLCLMTGAGVKGPIYLTCPQDHRETIAALFPELVARMIFDPPALHLAEALVPMAMAPALYLLPQAEWDALEQDIPPAEAWQGRQVTAESLAYLARHAIDATLFTLRARALAAAPTGADLPRRFWIQEAGMQAELAELLALFDIRPVDLTGLSVLQQVALFAGAEMVINPPAFLLLFLPPEATVLQLSPRAAPEDAAWQGATVSGCRLLHLPTAPEGLSRLSLARLMSLIVTLLDQVPEFHSAEEVEILGRQLLALNETDRAARLFRAHETLAEGQIGLSLAMADLAERQEDRAATLAALYSAYRADPSDWAILIRMLWCARAMDQAHLTSVLLATLHDGFPERFDAFSRARPWVRDFYSPPVPEAQ